MADGRPHEAPAAPERAARRADPRHDPEDFERRPTLPEDVLDVHSVTEPLEEVLRQAIIRIVDEQNLALTGWEGIGDNLEPVR